MIIKKYDYNIPKYFIIAVITEGIFKFNQLV